VFTYISLKNFKSFDSIYFDLKKNQKQAKSLVALYGENGSGKSNLVSAFSLLNFSFGFLKDMDEETTSSFQRHLKASRMIGNEDNTEVEYGFLINGIEGYYKLVFKDSLVSEELYYVLKSKRGVLYKISRDKETLDKRIHTSVFLNDELSHELSNKLDEYWGEYSFLGILINMISNMTKALVDESISTSLIEVLYFFSQVHVVSESTTSKNTINPLVDSLDKNKLDISNLEKGLIPIEKEDILKSYEETINYYFSSIYSDIRQAFYKTQIQDNEISYELCFKKMIGRRIREIPYSLEASGVKRMLLFIRSILLALEGKIVIFDGMDRDIHEIQIREIMNSLDDNIKGQLIITAHNTILLENLSPSSIYVIYIDAQGNKEIRCLNDYDYRIRANNNVRDLYLNGLFGGIPYLSYLHFSNN